MVKLLRLLGSKEFYHTLSLLVLFSLLVYPPSIGIATTQRVNSRVVRVRPNPLKQSSERIDTLKLRLLKVDSLLQENNKIIQKQQDTIKKQKL